MNYLTSGEDLKAVADAIRAKSRTEGQLVFPDGYVEAIGKIVPEADADADVLLWDDLTGKPAYRFSAEEFLALEELPENPDHSGFSCHGISIPMDSQGWNWTLSGAQEYVEKYGKLNIGQLFTPADGKTHYAVYIPEDAPESEQAVTVSLDVDGDGDILYQVDDGTPATATIEDRKFSAAVGAGWHDVRFWTEDAGTTWTLEQENVYQRTPDISLYGVFLSAESGAAAVGSFAFENSYFLEAVTIPKDVILDDACQFQYCSCLRGITLPDGILGRGGGASFNGCGRMEHLALPELPGSETIPDNIFYGIGNVDTVTVPEGITKIGIQAFRSTKIRHIILPDGVTTVMRYSIAYNEELRTLRIPDTLAQISGDEPSGIFRGNSMLESFTLPEGITYTYQSLVSGNSRMRTFTFAGSGVTTISAHCFNQCYSLMELTIPESVTNIDRQAFQYCYRLHTIIMLPETPPVLENTNAFTDMPEDYRIIVPAGCGDTYKAASKWSTIATHIVEAE